MKIAVIGSRDFTNYQLLKKHLNNYQSIDTIISGGAKGADKLAEKYAEEFNITMEIHPPDWKTYGKSAGPIRNKIIVENGDLVLVFWDGKSKGTEHSIKYAKTIGKCVEVVTYNSDETSDNK